MTGWRMRDRFENSWKNSLNKAEVKPSDRVWHGIESRLSEMDTLRKYRRQARFYKFAASMALILSLGLIAWNISMLGDMPAATKEDNSVIPSGAITFPDTQSLDDVSPSGTQADRNNTVLPPINTFTSSIASPDPSSQAPTNPDVADNTNDVITPVRAVALGFQVAAPKGKHVHKVDQTYLLLNEYDEKPKDGLLSLNAGVTSGMFDPNFTNNTTSSARNTFQQPVNVRQENANQPVSPASSPIEPVADYSSDQLFALHLKGGVRLTKRLTLLTGIMFGEYRTQITSNTVYETEENRLVPLNNYSRDNVVNAFNSSGAVISNIEYQTLNSFRMVSVPVELSYRILDKDFFLSVKGGVQSNFNMGYSIRDEFRYFDKITIEPGEETPYKDYNFNYLIGGVVGYNLNSKYAVTVEPSFAASLSDFSKETASFSSSPTVFSVSAGIQYLF